MLTSATIDSRVSKGFSEGCLAKFHNVYWIIHAISNAIGFLISIIYWTTIYGPSGGKFTATNFFVHGSNSITIFLDLCITAHPIYLIHCCYPMIFGLVYLTFSIIFYFCDKGRGGSGMIYNILDWNYPGKTTGIVIGILFFVIFLHALTFIIYKLKIIIYEKIMKSNNQSQQEIHSTGPPEV
nr:protein rolling stone-like [Leptinotarsa decemlineata]